MSSNKKMLACGAVKLERRCDFENEFGVGVVYALFLYLSGGSLCVGLCLLASLLSRLLHPHILQKELGAVPPISRQQPVSFAHVLALLTIAQPPPLPYCHLEKTTFSDLVSAIALHMYDML